MKYLILLSLIFLVGCNNLENKSIVGNGLYLSSRVKANTGIETIIVSGKLQTILKDSNLLTYSKEETSSIFNSNSKTVTESLTISVSSKSDLSTVLSRIAEIKK